MIFVLCLFEILVPSNHWANHSQQRKKHARTPARTPPPNPKKKKKTPTETNQLARQFFTTGLTVSPSQDTPTCVEATHRTNRLVNTSSTIEDTTVCYEPTPGTDRETSILEELTSCTCYVHCRLHNLRSGGLRNWRNSLQFRHAVH